MTLTYGFDPLKLFGTFSFHLVHELRVVILQLDVIQSLLLPVLLTFELHY